MSWSHAWTWRHAILKSGLPATTRHVLLTISCHMNDLGEGCYPTQEDLAEETGLSERAVRKHIKLAVDEGWLTIKEHGFRGQSWRNYEYSPAWPDPQHVDSRAEPRSSPSRKRTEPRAARSGKRTGTSFQKVRNEVPPSISYNFSDSCADGVDTREGEHRDIKMLCPPDRAPSDRNRNSILDRTGELYAALGVTDETKSPGLLVISEPINWAENGCDVDLDILPTLKAIAARRTGPPRSWAYCSEAVFAARDKRLAPPPKTQQPAAPTQPRRETLGTMWAEEAKARGLIDDPSNQPR